MDSTTAPRINAHSVSDNPTERAESQLRIADVPPGGVQLRIPHLRFDAKRGCDRIRRRVYADPRIRPLVGYALVALSEFVDVRRKAWPKQDLLASMLHTRRQRVGEWLAEAADLGVLEVDRNRPGGRCCYTFAESWVRWFVDDGTDNAQMHACRASGSTAGVHLEARQACIPSEPGTGTKEEDCPSERQRNAFAMWQAKGRGLGLAGMDEPLPATKREAVEAIGRLEARVDGAASYRKASRRRPSRQEREYAERLHAVRSAS